MSSALISVQELSSILQDPDLLLLDASMQNPLPGIKNDVEQGAIPGSIRFDLEQVFSDLEAQFSHTRLSPRAFEDQAQLLGINNDSNIVVYDNMGIYSSPRAWWMLTGMGHKRVRVLNGGLPAWQNAGLAISEYSEPKQKGDFTVEPKPDFFIDSAELLTNLGQPDIQILDARSPARFYGKEPEPRQGVRSGHIPGSQNLHYRELTKDGFLQSEDALNKLFADRKIRTGATQVFSCGSGITACIQALAATQAGYHNLRVFDGSWSEWGATHSLPIELD